MSDVTEKSRRFRVLTLVDDFTRRCMALVVDTLTLLDGARMMTSPFSLIALHHFHGAAARVPVTDTAFGLRRDHLLVEVLAAWQPSASDSGAPHRQWARAVAEELAPFGLPGGYPNLLGVDEHERVRLAYGRNLARILQLKRRFDPDNVFASATPTLPPTEEAKQ